MVATLAKGSPMLRELKPRKDMFGTEDAMYLTTLGAMIETRMEVEARREAMFAKTHGWADDEVNGYDEVIIGGGPTAAAYAAARVLSGKPRPLVITDTLGGRAFGKAMDGKPPAPWFRLNSSNRPGELGLTRTTPSRHSSPEQRCCATPISARER
jgi:nicotinamide riboside kinase